MHTHIVGIGGAGMNPLAQLLIEQGEQISGCDRTLNPTTTVLAQRGATIHTGHHADHLDGVDRLLVTSALPSTHVEIKTAHERGIPVLTRHDLWREWSRQRPTIGITGTHGKTTTTAMIALILNHAGLQPGYVVGADVPALGGNAAWGKNWLVIEADEYARTFLALTPQIAVITNLDWDHVDIYPTQAEYDHAFRQYATQPNVAALVMCGDDAGIQRVLGDVRAIRCGLNEGNDWRATDIQPERAGMRFNVVNHGSVWLGVSGEHNVRNAVLALAVADHVGVDFATAVQALSLYGGAARRFEYKGSAHGVDVFDDYAHHPTEIRATLAAARQRFGNRRLVVYFQPHTYSRLHAFLDDFSQAFGDADIVLIGAVYGARETVAGADPAGQIVATMNHDHAIAAGDLDHAYAHVYSLLQPDDVLMTLGAGDGVQVGERWLVEQRAKSKEQTEKNARV